MTEYNHLSRRELLDLLQKKDREISQLADNDGTTAGLKQRLRSLNAVMETVLERIPVAIVVKSVADGFRHIYFNSTAEKISGLAAEKMLGLTDYEIFADKVVADSIREKDKKALYNGEFSQYAIPYQGASGEQKIINSIRLLVNTESSPLIISLIWDITDQRRQELSQPGEKDDSDIVKSAFLANMSHEIRTPLNAIVGFSSILGETDDEEERKCYLEIIHRNNELLLHLMNDILDFSRIESDMLDFRMGEVDLKEICRHLFLIYSVKMPPRVVLEFDANGLPPLPLRTDEKRVMQVLTNLLSNAVKFTKKGRITLSYRAEGGFVRVSVADTGIGIAPENQAAVFDRFVKVDDFGQGVGLGLPISRRIVEKLGGSLGMESELGKGSVFWFTLPLEATGQGTDAAHTAGGVSVPECRKRTTILIAEDVEENFYLLQVVFGKTFNLYHARNGADAVSMFREIGPDLVLMDLKMPEMDGFEASRQIRRLSETVPIIALSAFSHETEKKLAKKCRIDEYLVKPLDIALLKETVNKYLNGPASEPSPSHC